MDLSFILQAVKCHAASSQVRRLQIQAPRMLYFLTCTVYFIDRYNAIYDLDKYLIDIFYLNLTDDNEWNQI
jgi:hypothetical protein